MRRPAVAVALGMALIGATAIGAVAAGIGGAPADGEPPTAPSSVAAPPATTAPPVRVGTTTPPVTTTPGTAPSTTATTIAATATTTTIAPIVTHAATIDLLAPVAIAAPVAVQVPALDIDGPVTPTGVNELGELAVPPDARTLVWWQFGPTPGAPGSAVIAGHLNWRGVEGVFSDLADMPVGATFTVTYDDDSQRAFVVRTVELVDKPAVAVDGTFAKDGETVLRLVTCGGEFDSSTRHYRSNVIVTAVPA
ncbi:MAG: class F sortase [Ilumatobacteraceae bacterium]